MWKTIHSVLVLNKDAWHRRREPIDIFPHQWQSTAETDRGHVWLEVLSTSRYKYCIDACQLMQLHHVIHISQFKKDHGKSRNH